MLVCIMFYKGYPENAPWASEGIKSRTITSMGKIKRNRNCHCMAQEPKTTVPSPIKCNLKQMTFLTQTKRCVSNRWETYRFRVDIQCCSTLLKVILTRQLQWWIINKDLVSHSHYPKHCRQKCEKGDLIFHTLIISHADPSKTVKVWH